MLSLEEIRKVEPKLKDLPDEKVAEIRDSLYQLAELALDSYIDEQTKEK